MTGKGSIRGPGPDDPSPRKAWRAFGVSAGASVILAAAIGLFVLRTPRPAAPPNTLPAVTAELPRAIDLPRVSFPTPRGAQADPDEPTAWMKNPAHVDQLKQMTLKIADADARAIRRMPYFNDVRAAVDKAYNEGVFNNYSPSLIGDDLWSIVNGDLYRQDGKTRVVDASTISGLTNYSFDNFMPSPDGRHVGFVVSDAGTEFGYARILDVASGQVLPQVYGPLIGDGSFDWIDDTAFAYTRTPTTDLKRGDPSANNVSYIAKLGQPGPGKPILGAGVGAIPVEGRFTPAIWGARSNSDMALGVIFGVTTAEFWLTPRAALVAGDPKWTRLASFADDVDDATPFFNQVILVRPGAKGLPQLAAYDVATKQTRVIREGSPDLLWTSSWASDHIAYVFARSGAQVRLFQLDAGLNLKEIRLPFEGALSEFSGVYGRSDELTFKLSSITEPEHFIRVKDGLAETIDVARQEDDARRPPMTVALEMAVSADGTKIPMTIVEPASRGGRADTPTLLHAYGAYGMVEMDERSPAVTLWVQLGGVDASCHVRGGGYYGKPWHDAGKGPDKTKAHEDLIACAQHLIDTGRARPWSLALAGGSAGGMVVGPVAMRRPDLFRAAVLDYAELNPLDSFDQPNGSAQIDEYGDASKPEAAAKLRSSDTFTQARRATATPDLLFCFGLQDRRVSFWESTRLAATIGRRFPKANVAILADQLAGHSCGFANTSRELLALKYTWLLAELDPRRAAAQPD